MEHIPCCTLCGGQRKTWDNQFSFHLGPGDRIQTLRLGTVHAGCGGTPLIPVREAEACGSLQFKASRFYKASETLFQKLKRRRKKC